MIIIIFPHPRPLAILIIFFFKDPNYPNTISGEWVWAPNLTIGPKTSYREANNGFTFCRRVLGDRYWGI